MMFANGSRIEIAQDQLLGITDQHMRELMQYHKNRIARATIEAIAERLATEWLEKNKADLYGRINIDDVAALVMRNIVDRANPNFFTRND